MIAFTEKEREIWGRPVISDTSLRKQGRVGSVYQYHIYTAGGCCVMKTRIDGLLVVFGKLVHGRLSEDHLEEGLIVSGVRHEPRAHDHPHQYPVVIPRPGDGIDSEVEAVVAGVAPVALDRQHPAGERQQLFVRKLPEVRTPLEDRPHFLLSLGREGAEPRDGAGPGNEALTGGLFVLDQLVPEAADFLFQVGRGALLQHAEVVGWGGE